MSSNKRRRSSDGSSAASSKFAAVSEQQPPTDSMFISLPAPRLPEAANQVKRRTPLTPPSVTPPSVTVSGSNTLQRSRDRCQSPGLRASDLLAKVAVVSSTPGTVPSSPRLCAASVPDVSGLSSSNPTPTATPPDDGGQFPFASSKQLPESPDGGYISFPMFEAFGDYGRDRRDRSGDDDGSVSPTRQ